MGVARLDLMVTAQTGQAQAQLKALELRMEKTMTQASILTGAMTSALTAVGTMAKLSVAAFAGLSAAAVGTTALVSEFNKNMQHSAAIAGFNKDQLDKLTRTVNSLSIQFGQSADNMSAGMVELTKSGLSMSEIESVMDDITKAMLANAISFETAAQIGIFSVKQFGDSFADLPEMFDKIQVAAQSTIMDFEDLQQALQYAGSMAVLSKVDFEQLLGVFGTLSQRAMKMGVASRSVNQMMMSLIDHTDEMQQWVDQMGLGVEVIKDGALNLDGLIRAFSNMDMTMDQLKKSSDIFTTRALRSWGLLITGAEEYMELVDEKIPGAQGALTNVFEKQQQTLSFQLSQMGQMLMAPYRDPEYMDKLLEIISSLKQPVAEISRLLASGLWGFLKDVSERKEEYAEFFTMIVENAMQVATVLYNIGDTIYFFKDFFGLIDNFLVKALINFKILKSMSFGSMMTTIIKANTQINMLKQAEINLQNQLNMLKQNGQYLQQTKLILGNKIVQDKATETRLVGVINKLSNLEKLTQLQKNKLLQIQNQLAATRNSIASKRLDIATLTRMQESRSVQLRNIENKQMQTGNTMMQARLQMYVSSAAAMASMAMSAAVIGRSMGFDSGTALMMGLQGAIGGAVTGSMIGGPTGAVVGGIAGAVGSAGIYTLSSQFYKEPETPDFAEIENIMGNVDYSEPAQAQTASESYSFARGGMIPQNGWYYMHQGEEVNNSPGKGGDTYVFNFKNYTGNRRELKKMILESIDEAKK